jgi:hypothetical protein
VLELIVEFKTAESAVWLVLRVEDPPLPDPVDCPTEELIVLLSRFDVTGAELA